MWQPCTSCQQKPASKTAEWLWNNFYFHNGIRKKKKKEEKNPTLSLCMWVDVSLGHAKVADGDSMVRPWGCLHPSAPDPSIIYRAKLGTYCPTPVMSLTSQCPFFGGVCSASMQGGWYDTTKIGNICLPLNLMGYECLGPQGAVVLLYLLKVTLQVSGRTWI